MTVTGTIHMHKLPSGVEPIGAKSGKYPVMTFDRVICVKDARWGDVTDGKVTSVFVMGAERRFQDGQHVSLRGELSPRQMASQPPEELILFVTNMPPDAPQKDENVINGSNDDVARKCADMSAKLTTLLGAKTLRVIVTKSPRWGTVWRADTAHPLADGDPPMLMRTVCSKSFVLERPLEMFDPSKSIPPLASTAVPG